jgi:hypothetical protein
VYSHCNICNIYRSESSERYVCNTRFQCNMARAARRTNAVEASVTVDCSPDVVEAPGMVEAPHRDGVGRNRWIERPWQAEQVHAARWRL